MKKKIYAHPDVIIAVLALVLLFVLIAFYFWATDAIVTQVRRALTSAAPQNAVGFDLDGAAKLDLRGLLGQSSSSTADIVPEPPAASAIVPSPVPVAPATPVAVVSSTVPLIPASTSVPAVRATTTQGSLLAPAASTTQASGTTP